MTLNEILEGDISRNVKKRNINESLIKFKDRNTVWDRSSFKPLTRVSNDDKGEWGEDFIQNLISDTTELSVEWDGNSNTSNGDGIYDIKINKKRTEVKTATVGYDKEKGKITNTYQHENIYDKMVKNEKGKWVADKDGDIVWDNLLLLDIKPEGFYLTHIEFNDMCFGDERHPILKKKSTRHLSAWKFDTSRAVLQRGLENGYTIYVPVNSDGTYSTENIGEFFEKHFTT